MKDIVVYINDKRVDYRKAGLSVFDYTIHCGIGLFESLLGVDDRLILLDEHLDRIETGIKRLGLSKLNYNRKRTAATLRRASAEHPARVKRVKLLLTQGYSPMWPGAKPKPSAITIVMPHRLSFKKQRLVVSPMIITPENPLRGAKTLSFMTEWLSQNKAIEQGYDQGIIVNAKGQIAETGSANLFMVKNGRILTPPIKSGGLPGITREEVFRIAASFGIPCREKILTPRELVMADEIFTTSSFKLVWPVVEVKLDKPHKFEPGEISRRIFDQMKSDYLRR